jgi:pimeloyl-ACP methyl ester carboxylesterase
MEIKSGFAEVNGTRLYYEMAGTDQPLVLIHGFTLDTRMWDDQFETFARRWRVLRYDLRGFGKSALPDGAYGHEADLMALLVALEMGRADVIGLSRGGMVALDFAFVYPEAVRSLVLVDALYGGFRWSAEWRESMDRIWGEGREQGSEAAKQSWLDHPLFTPIREQREAGARLEKIITDYSGWHFVNDDPGVNVKPPSAKRLDQTQAPTLVIVGERDLPDFHDMADNMARQIPTARKVVLEKAGHMSNMEAPEQFNETVLGFLDDQQSG